MGRRGRGISLFSLCVYGHSAKDQALNKNVYASVSKTVVGASYPKEYAVDEDPATRWSSEPTFTAVNAREPDPAVGGGPAAPGQ